MRVQAYDTRGTVINTWNVTLNVLQYSSAAQYTGISSLLLVPRVASCHEVGSHMPGTPDMEYPVRRTPDEDLQLEIMN